MTASTTESRRVGLAQLANAVLWVLVVAGFGSTIVRVLVYCATEATHTWSVGGWWRAALLAAIALFNVSCYGLAIRLARLNGRGWWRAVADGTWQAGLISWATGVLAVAVAYFGA